MESRLIYTLGKHYAYKVEWLNWTYENGAWIYIVDGDELRKDLIFEKIKNHLTTDIIYVVLGRSDSRTINRLEIETNIEDILGNTDFMIWDSKFERVVELNSLNCIMRLGKWNPKLYGKTSYKGF